jgi:hypothetical protein
MTKLVETCSERPSKQGSIEGENETASDEWRFLMTGRYRINATILRLEDQETRSSPAFVTTTESESARQAHQDARNGAPTAHGFDQYRGDGLPYMDEGSDLRYHNRVTVILKPSCASRRYIHSTAYEGRHSLHSSSTVNQTLRCQVLLCMPLLLS